MSVRRACKARRQLALKAVNFACVIDEVVGRVGALGAHADGFPWPSANAMPAVHASAAVLKISFFIVCLPLIVVWFKLRQCAVADRKPRKRSDLGAPNSVGRPLFFDQPLMQENTWSDTSAASFMSCVTISMVRPSCASL